MNATEGKIAILSPGVWQLRRAIKEITGYEPIRWRSFKQSDFGCVVGWGLKPTSKRARKLAERGNKSYLALEDGFIRSVRPGNKETPLSLIIDRSGIHYDCFSVSDLEAIINKSALNTCPERMKRANSGINNIKFNRISKYNHAPNLDEFDLGLDPARRKGRVLVVDQTAGDASIVYGGAQKATFQHMLEAAKTENPDSEIVVKLHPEVVSGRKVGHFGELNDPDIKLVQADVNPWSLIDVVDKVYVVTSQFGFDALLGGRHVVCFGRPFYSGWGLTDDRLECSQRTSRPTIEQLFAAVYFDYCHYISPETGKKIEFETAVEWITRKRDKYLTRKKLKFWHLRRY